MRNITAIAWKEIRSFFNSPIAYIVALVYLGITGYFFVNSISVPFPEAHVRGYLEPSTFILVLFAPALTMRLLSEEQKLGTFELLLTSPVRDWEVVIGKYLAATVFFVFTLGLTLYYYVLMQWFGNPDTGPVFTGYLGMLLMGMASLAVGLLASSLTSNQIVAAMVGFGMLLLLSVIHLVSNAVTGLPSRILQALSMNTHFEDFAQGVINTADLAYYISMTVLFLFLTVRILESRRWR